MCRVLVVEDDTPSRDFIRLCLCDEHKVYEAKTVREALSALSTFSFDVVLLDLSLPDGHGENILSQVSSDVAAVVITSFKADSHERAKLLNMGALYVLLKPFAVDELKAIVRRSARYAKANATLRGAECLGGSLLDELRKNREQLEDARRLLRA